jgi:hypothetical protein
VSIETLANNDFVFGFGDDASNRLYLELESDGDLKFIYTSGGTNEVVNPGEQLHAAAGWHFVECAWSQSAGFVYMYVDGVLKGSTAIANAWGGDGTGTLYVGARYDGGNSCDCLVGGLTITNDHNTPPVPFALGAGQLWAPKVSD